MPYRNKSINQSFKEEKKRKGNTLIFIICLFIAALFWLLIKLSDDYSENIEFRVEYYNIPAKERLTEIIDSTLRIKVSTNGFNMLKFNNNDANKLIVDLNECELNETSKNTYFINTRGLQRQISENYSIPEENIQLLMQRLSFKLEKLKSKKIKVETNVGLEFASQFQLYSDLQVYPNSITVYGPANIIDTLNTIFTQAKKIQAIDSDINELLSLVNPSPALLNLAVDKVKVTAKVEKFTELSLEIPIDISKTPYKLKVFPPQVKVFFKVAVSDFSKVSKNDFKVAPDFSSVNLLKVNKLHLLLKSSSPWVNSTRIQPNEVEFLILK